MRRRVVLGASAVFAMTTFAASPAHGAWVAIGHDTGGSLWYMDGDRITAEGSRIHAWIKIDASRDTSVKYRQAMEQYSFICNEQKVRVISSVQYDSYGKVIKSASVPDSAYTEYGYDPVIPESMGEAVMKIACGFAEKR